MLSAMDNDEAALVYMAITFTMPLEYNSQRGVALCNRSWECEGQSISYKDQM